MAFSYVSYTGDGSTQNYTLPFSYINKTDITVKVNGVSVPFTWNSTSVVRITTAPTAASAIQIQRVTQKATVPVNFTDGSTLLESDLDTLALYVLYVAQEQADFPPDSAAAAAAASASASAAATSAASAAASALNGANPTVTSILANGARGGVGAGLQLDFSGDNLGRFGVPAASSFAWQVNNSTKATLDAKGRLHIGTPLSAWGSQSIDVNGLGLNGDGTNFAITNNAYFDGTNWIYRNGNAPCTFQANANTFSWYTAPAGVTGQVISFNEKLRLDVSGQVLTVNCTGLGYTTTSGGTVTQSTSKSTGVILNKPTGQITMNAASLAAGATVFFNVSCSAMTLADTVVIHKSNGGTSGAYQVWIDSTAEGSFYVAVKNYSGSAFAEAINIQYSIIKGATS